MNISAGWFRKFLQFLFACLFLFLLLTWAGTTSARFSENLVAGSIISTGGSVFNSLYPDTIKTNNLESNKILLNQESDHKYNSGFDGSHKSRLNSLFTNYLSDEYVGVWSNSNNDSNADPGEISLALITGGVNTIVGTANFHSESCGSALALLGVQTHSIKLLNDVVYGSCEDLGTITLTLQQDGSLFYLWTSPDNLTSETSKLTKVSGDQGSPADKFTGVWSDQDNANWPILMTIIKGAGVQWTTVGIAGFAQNQCGANLALKAVTDTSIELLEHITYGSCWDLGTFTLTPQENGTLSYSLYLPGNPSVSNGTLRKLSSPFGYRISLPLIYK